MSNNMDDQFLQETSHSIQGSEIQKSLQNPFSLAWSKLLALFQANHGSDYSKPDETNPFESLELDVNGRQNLYPHFTDRVDPSLPYVFFFPPY